MRNSGDFAMAPPWYQQLLVVLFFVFCLRVLIVLWRWIAKAARIVRPGGVIAFTDWVEGSAGLTDSEAQRFLGMMTFANVEDIAGYVNLLSGSGCEVRLAEDTGRFPSYIDLYLNMIEMQLTYDVLRTLAFRTDLLQTLTDGFRFLGELSRAGKIAQARFVARRG
jgi:hypothetical protein